MKNEHITFILDKSAFDGLSEHDLTVIKNHVLGCVDCRQSFEAAKISAALLKICVAENYEPSPFFETRVMSAWREKQARSVAAFWRWWQASSAVVSAMVITVAALLIITLFVPNAARIVPEQASLLEDYSTETVILNETDLRSQLTTNQALQIIYDQQKAR